MTTRLEVTNTILNACKSVAPQVNWTFNIMGAYKSNKIEGTVTCNELKFTHESKATNYPYVVVEADYDIIIVDMQGETDIDIIADNLRSVFDGSNMGGLVYDVRVNRIAYGAVQGYTKSSVVKLEMKISYRV